MDNYETPHPFGSAISARTWSDANRQYRYGFNGKEKDFERANDDFPKAIGIGARIYDGRFGRWLSLDPLFYSYPSCSPFSGMGNSPIMILDINGKILKIQGTGIIVIYENGILYNEDGNIYTGNDNFIEKTFNDLKILEGTQTGLKIINEIETKKDPSNNTDEIVTIVNATASNAINGESARESISNTLSYDPNNTDLPTEISKYMTPGFIVLAHEFAHAESDLNNHPNRKDNWIQYQKGSQLPAISVDEIYASPVENKIKFELGLPLRTHYTLIPTSRNARFGNWNVDNSLLIDNNKKSLHYFFLGTRIKQDPFEDLQLDYDPEQQFEWIIIKIPYDYRNAGSAEIEPSR